MSDAAKHILVYGIYLLGQRVMLLFILNTALYGHPGGAS
jgi:hypothetical protein